MCNKAAGTPAVLFVCMVVRRRGCKYTTFGQPANKPTREPANPRTREPANPYPHLPIFQSAVGARMKGISTPHFRKSAVGARPKYTCPQYHRWQASIRLSFFPGTSLNSTPGPSPGSLYCADSQPDSAAASHALIPAFPHVVIMLKKVIIVKESSCRIRYSRGVEDTRLEGHDAALFI